MSELDIKMEVDEQPYSIEWVEIDPNDPHATITAISAAAQNDLNDLVEEDDGIDEDHDYLVDEEIIPSTEINTIQNSLDKIAAENLIYMAHDGNVEIMGDLIEEQVDQVDNADYNEQQYFECQVTEEVITDDWVQQQGEERVEIPVNQLGSDCTNAQDVDVPLPTDQDEYTASRPYPCDFCSRRFRKKSNLMNHMIAHKNDRPHICNLCGARYIRRVDLLTHLKVHAQIADEDYNDANEEDIKIARKEVKSRKTPSSKPPKEKKIKSMRRVKDNYGNVQPPSVYIDQLTDGGVGNVDDVDEPTTVFYGEEIPNQPLSPQSVEVHYPVIDPTRPFVCQKCGISFARQKALMSHVKMHVNDATFECDSCSELFGDAASLREHQKIQHAGETSNSEYEPENDKYLSDSDVDSKFGEYYCTVCGMAFHRQELLKRHQIKCEQKSLAHNEAKLTIKPHCCNVCGESFYEALDLLAHAEMHARIQPLKCNLCGESFLEEKAIKGHIVTFHAMELNENTCRICGKQCRDPRTLMKHAWEHSREKNYSCSKCGKTFHNKARLKRHMQSHRNKTVICEVCNKHFPDGRTFMNHRHSHNNVSGRQFPCKECNKTFGSRSSQQIHMRIHTGERPYGCRFCWKAFADGGTLRKHERIHTGEKPYACPVCPRAFNQRVVLREHIRSHHSGPDSKLDTVGCIYACTVCGDLMSDSQELIQHLIEHSDTNTAMKRQPQAGPRKYKRRRKLKPHELERLRMDKEKNNDLLDDETINKIQDKLVKPEYERKPTKIPTQKREKQLSFSDCSFSVFCNLENALQNIDPLVMPIKPPQPKSTSNKKRPRPIMGESHKHQLQPSRPKMIHTEKARVPLMDGKRKSKTMIRRTMTKDAQIKMKLNNKIINKTEHSIEKSAHNAEFSHTMSETELLLELSKKKIKYSPDVVNDLEEILRSPIKSYNTSEEFIQSSYPIQQQLPQHQQMSTTMKNKSSADVQKRHSESPIKTIKQELPESGLATKNAEGMFTCEMCSAVFRERAQLLTHVPIHI